MSDAYAYTTRVSPKDHGFSRSTTSYSFLGNGVWYTREWNTQCQSITGTPSASPTATPAPSPPSTTAVAPSAHPNLRVSSSAFACESGTDSRTSVSPKLFGVFGGGSVNRASAPGTRASTASAPPASSSRSISETSRRAGADATATTSPANAPGAHATRRGRGR